MTITSGMARMRRAALLAGALTLVVLAGVLGGCGSSGSSGANASTLISQTFGKGHHVSSGNIDVSLQVVPSGSSQLTSPITLSVSGPFQSRGAGKLPAFNFTVGFSAVGKSGSVGLLATGTKAYVTIAGTSYELPAGILDQIQSRMNSTRGTSANFLSGLRIDPRQWLTDPKVVGTETIDGTETSHVSAGVDVAKLIADFSTIFQKAGQLGVQGAGSLPTITPAIQQKIAAAIKNPRVDFWTGTSDKQLRKLTVSLTVPISGVASTMLGGLTSAAITLTIGYTGLNQPQTITAPTTTAPFSQLNSKIGTILQGLRGGLGGGLLGSSGVTGGSGSGASGAGGSNTSPTSSAAVAAYAKCLQSAGGDPTKVQDCVRLLTKK